MAVETSVVLYWLVCGVLTIVFQNRLTLHSRLQDGEKAGTLVLRNFFFFIAGGFVLPFSLAAIAMFGIAGKAAENAAIKNGKASDAQK